MSREEFKWSTIRYRASKDLILVHAVQLKPMIKAHSSGKIVSSDISDVVIASAYSEKTHMKKLMMIKMMMVMMIIMNKLRVTALFSGRQNLTFAMKLGQKSDGRLQI